jgi:hypothetical protein
LKRNILHKLVLHHSWQHTAPNHPPQRTHKISYTKIFLLPMQSKVREKTRCGVPAPSPPLGWSKERVIREIECESEGEGEREWKSDRTIIFTDDLSCIYITIYMSEMWRVSYSSNLSHIEKYTLRMLTLTRIHVCNLLAYVYDTSRLYMRIY